MILALLLLGAAPAVAALHESAEWLALGHYRRAGAVWKSEADGPRFFLSPSGRVDPKAELEATIEALQVPGARCEFPGRAGFLERQGFAVPAAPCPRYEEWRRSIGADALSLVFADSFLNNPASMYGHTFLRLRRSAAGASGAGLLDYTLNFAGNADTANSLLYMFRGVFGLFPGNYSTFPYYMKVQEYADIESRDLWEYDLSLGPAAVERLLAHAWEMRRTHFDYYFFSENCSYQLLTMLDAADPSLGLARGFGFGTIPGNTVRAALARPGLVIARRYRPSRLNVLRARRAALSLEERKLAEGVLVADAALDGFSNERKAAILDAAYDLLRFRHRFAAELPVAAASVERRLLLARGRLGVASSEPAVPEPAALEEGHATMRAGLGAGAHRESGFAELSFRGALRDLGSPSRGYGDGLQLEMLEGRLRSDLRDADVYLEELDLLEIVSLAPWEPWIFKPSWRVATGVRQAKELGCSGSDCMYYGFDAGWGLSARAGKRVLAYAFAGPELAVSPSFAQDWRFGGGPTVGLRAEPLRYWALLLEGSYIEYAQRGPHRERLRFSSSWRVSRDLELRVGLDRRTPDREASAAVFWYF